MTATTYRHGTHRVRTPEATRAWVSPLLDRAGITRVADVTRLDVLGIPVWQAVRPASRNLSVSQGKGLTDANAWVSAVMESLELWHAEDMDHVPQVVQPLRAMRRGNPVPVRGLKWRRDALLLEDAPLAWLRATSLATGREGWLPRAMVEVDYRFPDRFAPAFFHVTSNGLASGNTREEALVHALCEVVERHGLWLASRDRRRAVALDPASIEAPPLRALLDRVAQAGMRLALHDLTWEAGLAVVRCDLVAPDLPTTWRGCGCHLDPDVAIARAITEAAQSRLTYIAGARDDLTQFADEAQASRHFARFVAPRRGRRAARLPRRHVGTIEGDLQVVLDRLARTGHEPWAVDLTRADVGVPVVVVHVPHLHEAHYG
jgi:ribosomal protein S12 methylthiotransferase accessory factor